MVLGAFISFPGFSQDTIHTSQAQKDTVLNSRLNNNKKKFSYRNQNKIKNEPAKKNIGIQD